MALPRIWVNDKVFIDGAVSTRQTLLLVPERDQIVHTLLGMIMQALDEDSLPGRYKIKSEE